MKKILSILGAIGLTTTSTTSLISCENQITMKTKGGNKPKPKPQKPPIGSNWKLMPQAKNKLSHPDYLNNADNKNYIFIYNNDIPKNYKNN